MGIKSSIKIFYRNFFRQIKKSRLFTKIKILQTWAAYLRLAQKQAIIKKSITFT